MALRGGTMAILLVGGALYFTDAGTVAWSKIQGLGDHCYGALSRVAPSVANPVCGAVVGGIGGLENMGASIAATLNGLQQSLLGADSLNSSFLQRLREGAAGLTSSKEQLMQKISRGPTFVHSDSPMLQLQQAMDSFEIGQQYLSNPSQASQAVPWLRNGAAQPQGFGVMSQLTLGNLYMEGGQGVPANPQLAKVYLQQAKDSLTNLMNSNTPQARQVLQALPASPQSLQQQIEQVMQGAKKK